MGKIIDNAANKILKDHGMPQRVEAGKGDKPRPIDKQKYDDNYDNIQWRSKKA